MKEENKQIETVDETHPDNLQTQENTAIVADVEQKPADKKGMPRKKKLVIALAVVLSVAVALGAFFGIYSAAVIYGTTTVTLDESKTYQTMEGFGASSAWIYQDFGKLNNPQIKEQAMEMLYGDSGLKLNTFRYNIGGGGIEVASYGDELRGAESFFVAENFKGDYSIFKDPGNYDFTRDAAVRELFDLALSKGNIEQVVFFANSPHYTMTLNGKTHGEQINVDNLKEECYEAFSDYLLVITDYLYENVICKYDKDIKVIISPVNEPQWKWGGEGATQEGCHYEPEALAKFYQQFYTTLNAFNEANGTNFEMDIFECGKYMMVASSARVNEYMTEFEKYPFFESVTNISAHSYGTDTSKFHRTLFSEYMDKYYSDLKISITEYCVLEFGVDPTMDMGIFSAQVIMRDLTMLDAVNWNYWLSISKGDYEDGLIYWNNVDGQDVIKSYKRYYAMGHFSKFIEAGSVRIDASYSDTLGFNGVECVAFKKTDGSIALVVINDSSRSHKINIEGGYANVTEVLTTEEENWKTSEYSNAGSVTIPANSIATYVFSK